MLMVAEPLSWALVIVSIFATDNIRTIANIIKIPSKQPGLPLSPFMNVLTRQLMIIELFH